MGNKSKIVTSLRYLDIFSESASLNIEGHGAYKTYIGTIFTLIYSAVMLAIVASQGQSYLDTTSPIAVGESYMQDKYPTINLNENKMLPVLIAYSNETEWIKGSDISQYLTLKAQKTEFISVIKQNGDADLIKNVHAFPVVPCIELSAEKKAVLTYLGENSLFTLTLDQYGLCPDIPLDLKVEGNGSDEYYSSFDFKIYPCSLTTGCKSHKEMIKVNFQLLLPSSKLNITNLNTPLTFTATADDIYYVNPLSNQVFVAKLKQFTVKDYIGILPSWKERISIHDIGSTTTLINYRDNTTACDTAEIQLADSDTCKPYFHFIFQSSGQLVLNKRTYPRLSDTIGAIGGTNGVVIIVMLMIYGPINSIKRKEYITRKIYSLMGNRDEEVVKSLADDKGDHKSDAVKPTGIPDNAIRDDAYETTFDKSRR